MNDTAPGERAPDGCGRCGGGDRRAHRNVCSLRGRRVGLRRRLLAGRRHRRVGGGRARRHRGRGAGAGGGTGDGSASGGVVGVGATGVGTVTGGAEAPSSVCGGTSGAAGSPAARGSGVPSPAVTAVSSATPSARRGAPRLRGPCPGRPPTPVVVARSSFVGSWAPRAPSRRPPTDRTRTSVDSSPEVSSMFARAAPGNWSPSSPCDTRPGRAPRHLGNWSSRCVDHGHGDANRSVGHRRPNRVLFGAVDAVKPPDPNAVHETLTRARTARRP